MGSQSSAGTHPCHRCHGVGTLLISLCCGRGCTNCVGEGMRQIDCHRCNGTGQAPNAAVGDAPDRHRPGRE